MAFDFSKVESIKLDDEKTKELKAKLEEQEPVVKRVIANDERIKMWKTPINDRALIYIPNFTRINSETNLPELDTLKAFIYQIKTGAEFLQFRDTTGLTGLTEFGVSGNDPLRKVEQENWEIYNAKLEAHAKKLGTTPKHDSLRDYRSGLINDFSVKPSNDYFYFPIVHLVTTKDAQGNSSVRTSDVVIVDGKPKAEVYLYRISGSWFNKFFKPILQTLPEDETLGGRFYQFSYITDKPTAELQNAARDSGLSFSPSLLPTPVPEELASHLDGLASFMTSEHLLESVYELMVLPDAVHEEVAKEAHKAIEMELKIIRAQAVSTASEGETQQIEGGTGKSEVESLMDNLGGESVETEVKTEVKTGETNGLLDGMNFSQE